MKNNLKECTLVELQAAFDEIFVNGWDLADVSMEMDANRIFSEIQRRKA